MKASLDQRLNRVIDRILSEELLSNAGLGNEIGFYIFDYDPAEEMKVRGFLRIVEDQLPKKKPGIRFVHINLFSLIVEYLQDRKLLDRAFELQKAKGSEELLKALKGPLHELKIAKYLVEKAKPEQQDVILMSGVGSAWPILRSHTLLNSLHPLMEDTPLVVFYPGKYDGQGLRLFGKLKESNYYRAFQLVPDPTAA
ncbi:DUF1788 domain-containing protein [Oleidesulfovibrio alaskensis]|jgi:hypothetical protein|uniref:DUF1788 domain-containing protein n=1 Tax=Oleidesulfovibrio alaskensis TaxID=58180 RepID=UPI001D901F11|nr:DUF1788 domain-containing protein [Oleidesulfovibrio alaskensis]MBG0773463.1 DUF1788 domain-containing protein [Oleidesulfovibrio alaskensis]